MLIDTHSHLNFSVYDKDREEVISRSLRAGLWMINASVNYETSKKAIEIAKNYQQGVYAAIGLHPIEAQNSKFKARNHGLKLKTDDFEIEKYKDLAQLDKVVAIGEIGLDYWNLPRTKAKAEEYKDEQKEILLKQLAMAIELSLPVIFHCRKAHSDLLDILRGFDQNSRLRGVIHSFSGKWREAEEYLKMGFYLGFNGIIFKLNLKKIIERAPLKKILVETDCPFLLPPSALPLAKAGRNEPIFIRYIVQRIAEIKNLPFEQVAQSTTGNAKELFGLY